MKLNFQMKDKRSFQVTAASETKQPMVRSSEMLVIKCAHTQLLIAQNARTKWENFSIRLQDVLLEVALSQKPQEVN